jgi:hypothetical protein
MGQNNYNIMNQGCQGWISSFPKITFDMWHSCVGPLFQILHFSYQIYNYVLDVPTFDYI